MRNVLENFRNHLADVEDSRNAKIPVSIDPARCHEAADEIERLQATVDKLPKCWRLLDGKLVQDVSVTPGMTIWRLWPAGEYVSQRISQLHGPFPVSREVIGDCNLHNHPAVECYSTREAAEAAKGGG